MARKAKGEVNAEAYKYGLEDDPKRLNIPEAGEVEFLPKTEKRPTATERNYDPRLSPQLVWSGKAGITKFECEEAASFEVPLVDLHIHERVSAEAIIRAARREDIQRNLFADPELDLRERIEYYRHEVGWANRLILGDSLQVMNSLAEREGMKGKVQMIYLDPPYGIKFGSNFQPRIDKKEVRDGADADLTREVEQVQAFRDTWELGVHSYLSYLRDRLIVAKDLLADSGSIFVQISDTNVNLVRSLLDEVFGPDNKASTIIYRKASPDANFLRNTFNYLLWYVKDIKSAKHKVRKLFADRRGDEGTTEDPKKLALWGEFPEGERTLTTDEKRDILNTRKTAKVFRVDKIVDSGTTEGWFEFSFQDLTSFPKLGFSWRGDPYEMDRLKISNRIVQTSNGLGYKFFVSDYPVVEVSNVWEDTAGKIPDMQYSVQTNEKIIERCILMASDPGDLVLDPTCGSGTTAYVAEQWGRRWITCDTSRVALSIARHRLLTADFDYYELRHPASGVKGGLKYKTVPHITLNSIAQNQEIDAIAAEFQPKIDAVLAELNKEKGKNWREWEVPREIAETDTTALINEYTAAKAKGTLLNIKPGLLPSVRFWELKRQMQAEINASIQKNAPTEELVDQPQKEKSILRVSGPFTVEAIPNVHEISTEVAEFISQDAGLVISVFEPKIETVLNAEGWIRGLIDRLRKFGVHARGGTKLMFESLESYSNEYIHATGRLIIGDETKECAVIFGPENGSISEIAVRDGLAASRKFDAVLFAGFDFTAAAQERIRLPAAGQDVFIATIAPDLTMGDLLKDTKASQLFTMVGEPDVEIHPEEEGKWRIEVKGIDAYNPTTGETSPQNREAIHAIFIDHNYDGRAFCICQALFPNKKDSWEDIAKTFKGTIDEDAFEAFRTYESNPFVPGERVQVKVIDVRGNSIVKTLRRAD